MRLWTPWITRFYENLLCSTPLASFAAVAGSPAEAAQDKQFPIFSVISAVHKQEKSPAHFYKSGDISDQGGYILE